MFGIEYIYGQFYPLPTDSDFQIERIQNASPKRILQSRFDCNNM